MSKRYRIARAAIQDMQDIFDYIWPENPPAAIALDDEFHAAFALIAENPGIGHRRADLTSKPYCFWIVRSRYFTVYRDAPTITIVRVLNSARDLSAIL